MISSLIISTLLAAIDYVPFIESRGAKKENSVTVETISPEQYQHFLSLIEEIQRTRDEQREIIERIVSIIMRIREREYACRQTVDKLLCDVEENCNVTNE